MLGARWYKVLYDLWGNKTRTSLIVLSIAAGLFALGMIANSYVILATEVDASYQAINPSTTKIQVNQTFDEDMVHSVRRMKGVKDAGGRTNLTLRYRLKKNGAASDTESAADNTTRWRSLHLFSVPDYDDIRVDKLWPQAGAWPPPRKEILLERASLQAIDAQIGDWLVIEVSDQEQRELRIAGTTHDLSVMPATVGKIAYGYVSYDTLEWLGEPQAMNVIHVVVQNRRDLDETRRVLNEIYDKLEKSGYTIPVRQGPASNDSANDMPIGDTLRVILLMLGAIGAFGLVLSAFLVVNTISALVTQQVRQIGILKAVGARAGQIAGMYLGLALVYGLIALCIAVPLGAVGGYALSKTIAGIINYDLTTFYVTPLAFVLQFVLGLLTPVLAALYPVLSALRLSAAEAMRSEGAGKGQYGEGRLDQLLTQVRSGWMLRLFPRPLMLSLRNTFRRKGRLALTLATLTLAGSIFIGVFSLRASLNRTMNDILGMYRYDVRVSFANRQRIERVDQQAQETPGVKGAAQWTSLSVRRIRPDGSEGDNIALLAPPADFDFFVPNITEGRSLQPGDTRALIINSGVLKKEPDIQLGHDVVLKIGGRQYTFHVVGQVLGMGMMPQVYASYDDIARITHDYGQARDFMMLTEQSDPSSQAQAATMLEAVFSQAGQHVNSAQSRTEEYASVSASFDTIIYLALVMAVLLAIVGGLGLTGTLGTNVIERTREIGVMRAIGAADGAVAQVFIVEGIVIGLLSWLFGAVLAIPMGQLFSQAIGQGFVQTSLTNVYSMEGVSLWLAVVLLVSALASFLPARNASRLTVRDVLAYE